MLGRQAVPVARARAAVHASVDESSQSTSARESLERAYASVVIKSLLIKGGRELRETTNCWMLDLARAAVKRQFLAPKHKGFRSCPSAPSVYLGGSCSRVKRVLLCLALVCI